MHIIRFSTAKPYDHAPRALDQLRTMGFDLEHMTIEAEAAGRFLVELGFFQQGPLAADTFHLRLARIEGLDILHTFAPVPASLLPRSRPVPSHEVSQP